MEERLPGLQVDALCYIIAPQLVCHINTTHIEIVLVYKLRNVHFFNQVVAKGLALLCCIGGGLCRSPATSKDVGLTWQYMMSAALWHGVEGDVHTIMNCRHE